MDTRHKDKSKTPIWRLENVPALMENMIKCNNFRKQFQEMSIIDTPYKPEPKHQPGCWKHSGVDERYLKDSGFRKHHLVFVFYAPLK
jgi:hypothetical protein